MKLKNQNALFAMVTSLLTVFNETQLALAESGTASSSASSQPTKAPFGLLIAYWICNSRKRKAIGGWLLFYYMQLFIGTAFSILMILLSLKTLAENLNIANWGNETMQYFLYITSVVPSDILLILELVFGSMLLSRKFRNRKFYNLLRITIAIQFGFGLIGYFIDSKYWPENIALDVLPLIGSAFWFLYFTFSKRVRQVFAENRWDSTIMYPVTEEAPDKHISKTKEDNLVINKTNKCPECKKKCSFDREYQCKNCGEKFWQSKEIFEKHQQKQV